jgi:hypothetical protein
MAFNPVADALSKLLEPMADELRMFGDKLLETLRGITAEQKKTNELLTLLVAVGTEGPAPKAKPATTPKTGGTPR